jgi:hypothetical protein
MEFFYFTLFQLAIYIVCEPLSHDCMLQLIQVLGSLRPQCQKVLIMWYKMVLSVENTRLKLIAIHHSG